MTGRPCAPRKLTKADVREGFDSGAPELDEWLARYSWQNQRADNAVTYVSELDGRVVGYYAITVASVTSDTVPERVSKGAPRQVPCLLLARLAVDRNMQGFGLGRVCWPTRFDEPWASPTPWASGRCWCIHGTTRRVGSIWRRPSYWSPRRIRCTCCCPSRTSDGRWSHDHPIGSWPTGSTIHERRR